MPGQWCEPPACPGPGYACELEPELELPVVVGDAVELVLELDVAALASAAPPPASAAVTAIADRAVVILRDMSPPFIGRP